MRCCTSYLLALFLVSNSSYSQNSSEQDSAEEPTPSASSEASPEFTTGFPYSISPNDTSLELVNTLVEAGAVRLAYTNLVNSETFLNFESLGIDFAMENKFYDLAVQLEEWDAIHSRVDATADLLQPTENTTAQLYAVQADMALRNSTAVRKRLRKLLWELPYDQSMVIQLRDLVIESYLMDQNYNDARIAMVQFSSDYRPNDPEWEHKYTRVLLASGFIDEAVSRISSLQSGEGNLLELSAQYQSGNLGPFAVIDAGLVLQDELNDDPRLLSDLWNLLKHAATEGQDTMMRVNAVENELYQISRIPNAAILLPLNRPSTTGDLLAAYDEHALAVGNSFNLLIGDDESWLTLAQEFEITEPVTARSIYSFLVFSAINMNLKEKWSSEFGRALATAGYISILERMIFEEDLINVADLANETRVTMVNRALRKKDYVTSHRIMKTMNEVPEGQDANIWELQRTRVAIFASDYDWAVANMNDYLAGLPNLLDNESYDRVVQIVFDLQDDEQHEAAIRLATDLFKYTADSQRQRELLHWTAESHSELNQHSQAAELLLRSAFAGETWDDRWGQSVRFRAAEELTKAEYYDDARQVYLDLRSQTSDVARLTIIDAKLKELDNLQ